MRPEKGVDSCHRDRDGDRDRDRDKGYFFFNFFELPDKATHLFCKYCVRN